MDKPPTAFQSRVYDVVRTIPKGSVRSYGSIATGEDKHTFASIIHLNYVNFAFYNIGATSRHFKTLKGCCLYNFPFHNYVQTTHTVSTSCIICADECIIFLAFPTELNTSARAVGTAMGKKAYELKDVP